MRICIRNYSFRTRWINMSQCFHLALAAAKQDKTLLQTDCKRLLLETASPEAAAALLFVVERMLLQLCSSSSKLLCNMRLCAGIKGCCRCSSSKLLCSETYSEHMIRHKNGSSWDTYLHTWQQVKMRRRNISSRFPKMNNLEDHAIELWSCVMMILLKTTKMQMFFGAQTKSNCLLQQLWT